MSSLLTVQREGLEGRSGTTASGSTSDEEQQQVEAPGDVLRTGPSGGSDFGREPTRRELLDRLGRSCNAYRTEDPFGGGKSYVPVGFVSAEDQFHPMMMLWASPIPDR